MAAKIFEVGDVLPATTQLRISWIDDIYELLGKGEVAIWYEDNLGISRKFIYVDADEYKELHIFLTSLSDILICHLDLGYFEFPYTNYDGNHPYIDIDTSTWDINRRTITAVNAGMDIFTWEDLNAPIPSGYTITFNSNGGSSISSINDATELPNPLPTPTKSGYTFVAWYYESNFQTRANAGDTIESNVTLYAKWHNLGSLFTEIADAIRSKDGTTELIKDLDFPDRIRALESGVDVSDANAVVGEVLAGKTFYAVDDTKKTGTMPNHGTVSTDITTKAQEVTIQQGYHSGSGKVKISATEQAKIIASNIKSGVTILGQAGAVTPAKEEQTKTVSPTTSSQDVLPDSGKVLSKVTVNAIPTETKSQQPSLGSGNQTINATSGKFMTSFTITKDTVNHIASNIRSGITLYGVAGNLQPAKEEETKTVTPDFSSGNQVITPTSGKVLSQVTLTKPTDLLPENIAKDKNVCGVVGTSFIAIELTQAQYDALETKDANTYYLING